MSNIKDRTIAIIPARMASTRFPGKPLAKISGISMIEHVRRRILLCPLFSEVIVATCDNEIIEEVTKYGGKAVMTSDKHERCTDRIEEAARNLDADIIVNIQGDEPLVRPEMFAPLLEPLIKEKDLLCANLMGEIDNDSDFNSPDIIKTVCDPENNALYFSREPIPSLKKSGGIKVKRFKQFGIIAFRKEFLMKFSNLPQTPLEKIESVDMLRALEHGFKVRMVESRFNAISVDTVQDLERMQALMINDDLIKLYK